MEMTEVSKMSLRKAEDMIKETNKKTQEEQ